MTRIVRRDERVGNFTGIPREFPVDIAANIEDTAPAGLPIFSTCFVVEKLDIAFSDGKDNWYAHSGSGVVSIKAGQPWSALFG